VVTGCKNVERLKRKMREHGAVFMKTEEVFDLPKQIFTKIKVDRSKEYSKFMKDCIVWIDETELVGDTTLTKMLYARQLCGHYNKEKLSAFMDLIQSTEDRVIVFYSFNAELNALKAVCKECDKPVSEVNGHTKDLTAYEEESNSVTLVQYQAGSKGLNLQKCNKIIYFTLPLSSEDFEQSKKRIHRIGQEKTCFYYLMICRGSIEERILKTLEERKDFTDELFKDS
jgi:SNF2 family DNA or RNA helicase